MSRLVLTTVIASALLAGRSTATRVPIGVCRRACSRAVAATCATPQRRAYRRCRRALIRTCRHLGSEVCDLPSTSTTTTTTLTEPTSTPVTTSTFPAPPTPSHIETVFVVMMENHDWSSINGNPSAPYINDVLLPMASHAQQYFNPPHIHPSEPNYIWLEAGLNFGILDDASPSTNHLSATRHLTTLLDAAGVSWKAYEEDIGGDACPLSATGHYAVDHDPFVFFDDVSGWATRSAAYCILHVRPYSELQGDLAADRVARYNFVTPNLCHDMHESCGGGTDPARDGDTWLSSMVPAILGSPAYARGGALFITWDEATDDGPIGMIVVSPFAKGGGYGNTIHYTHSSTLRTMEEIFAVGPMLGDAATATDLADLFEVFP